MKNKIYYGDNLDILRRYIKEESIDLCYIDPPFNSKRNYNQIYNNIGNEDKAQAQAFVDTWTWDDRAHQGLVEIKTNYNGFYTEQSIELITGLEKVLKKGGLLAYLVSMTLRIAEIHRVLKQTGSFYLHCDSTASHYLKLVCDTLFCAKEGYFLNEIIWKRGPIKGAKVTSRQYGRNVDIIFVYSKTKNYFFEQPYTPYDLNSKYNKFIHKDKNGRIYSRDNPLGDYSEESIKKFEEEGRIYVTRNGKKQLIRYLDEVKGLAIGCLWDDIHEINQVSKERLGYPTQKPEALLERIIKASSNEGDTVLDAYCGCGTTVAVAERLRRHWIGIDITYQSISLILKRLGEQSPTALSDVEINGVPRDWDSAFALANKQDDRTRKEFEKWMVLTYSRNRATINDKKGGDKGIDGVAFVAHDLEGNMKKVLLSVKSNKTLTPAVIRELNGTIEREGAACGMLLTLYPMGNLVKESKQYGYYHNELVNRDYPKIHVISVEDILGGTRMDLPNITEVLKTAKQQNNEQDNLF